MLAFNFLLLLYGLLDEGLWISGSRGCPIRDSVELWNCVVAQGLQVDVAAGYSAVKLSSKLPWASAFLFIYFYKGTVMVKKKRAINEHFIQ